MAVFLFITKKKFEVAGCSLVVFGSVGGLNQLLIQASTSKKLVSQR